MNPLSEGVRFRSNQDTRRSNRRKASTRPRRLTVESLETRCLLSAAAEASVGQSINAFGQDLYSQLQSQPGGSGNLFFSPTSIATALAMTYGGAEGETATQMAAVLHAGGLDANTLGQEFGSLLTDLNSAGQGQYALALADALWGQQGYSFNQSFLDLVQADYGGGLQQVDFIGNTEGARQTINNWVAQQTNDKIQNLIPKGGLTTFTRLVLTNAIYFKGNWVTPFDTNDTYDANFTNSCDEQVQVSTMHDTGEFNYMASNGYQVLEMPYQGGRLAMDVILPSAQSGLSGLSASQLPADLTGWLGGLSDQRVDVSLPKFTMTTSFDLSAPLQALGMTDAFSGNADFSGITSAEQWAISDVLHKAFISVTETGTEAAAATAIVVGSMAAPIPLPQPVAFNADHPFLFVIRDTQSGTVLFEGQVADPTSQSGDSSAPAIPASSDNSEPIHTQTDPVNTTNGSAGVPHPLVAPPAMFRGTPLIPAATVNHVSQVLVGTPIAWMAAPAAASIATPIGPTVDPTPTLAAPTITAASVPLVALNSSSTSPTQPAITVPSHAAAIPWTAPSTAVTLIATAEVLPMPVPSDHSAAVPSDSGVGAQEEATRLAASSLGLAATGQDQDPADDVPGLVGVDGRLLDKLFSAADLGIDLKGASI
jgi:serpin B